MKKEIDEIRNYGKDDIVKNLENINVWINNADLKSSIILGIYGIIVTILFTSDIFCNKYSDLLKEVMKSVDFSDVMYILFLILSFCISVYGIYKLIKVLIPTLVIKSNSDKFSHIYFGSISKFDSFNDFKESFNNITNEDYNDDLLNQLYINSKICSNKFNSFKIGLKYSLLGIIALIILFIIGVITYL